MDQGIHSFIHILLFPLKNIHIVLAFLLCAGLSSRDGKNPAPVLKEVRNECRQNKL
jgi:hypothetical protein